MLQFFFFVICLRSLRSSRCGLTIYARRRSCTISTAGTVDCRRGDLRISSSSLYLCNLSACRWFSIRSVSRLRIRGIISRRSPRRLIWLRRASVGSDRWWCVLPSRGCQSYPTSNTSRIILIRTSRNSLNNFLYHHPRDYLGWNDDNNNKKNAIEQHRHTNFIYLSTQIKINYEKNWEKSLI